MLKEKSEIQQLEDCKEKIKRILREYNCGIEFDNEMSEIIIHDKETNKFVQFSAPWKKK